MAYDFLETLSEMGLTISEATAYVYLLEHAPLTAYGVAKGIGKPTANTYKTVESLYKKGALILEETGKRKFRAVKPEELLGALERRFQRRKKLVAEGLSRLKGPDQDDSVYRLQTPEQVLERIKDMLSRCTQVVLLDLFPWSAEKLQKSIEKAAARGVSVVAKLYSPLPLKGVTTVLEPRPSHIAERWSGQWANVVIDAAEHLLALLHEDGKGVHQAIWSKSRFLSWLYHGGLVSELQVTAVEQALAKGLEGRQIIEILQEFKELLTEKTSGFRELRSRIQGKRPG